MTSDTSCQTKINEQIIKVLEAISLDSDDYYGDIRNRLNVLREMIIISSDGTNIEENEL